MEPDRRKTIRSQVYKHTVVRSSLCGETLVGSVVKRPHEIAEATDLFLNGGAQWPEITFLKKPSTALSGATNNEPEVF